MPTVFANGGIIGKTLDFNSTSFYNPNMKYVGGVTGTGSNSAASVAFSNLTGGIGGGVLTGDLVIALLAAGGSSNFTTAMATTGYTNLFDLYANGSGYDANLGLFYKVMGATPDTSAATTSFMTGGDGLILVIQVWRGANTSTPIGATASATGTGSTSANPPAITTTAKGSKVIAFGVAASSYAAGQVFTFGGDLENTMTATGPNVTNQPTFGSGAVKMLGGVRPAGTVVDPIAFSATTTNNNTSWAAATFELIPTAPPLSLMNSGIWDVSGRYVANTA